MYKKQMVFVKITKKFKKKIKKIKFTKFIKNEFWTIVRMSWIRDVENSKLTLLFTCIHFKKDIKKKQLCELFLISFLSEKGWEKQGKFKMLRLSRICKRKAMRLKCVK